MLAVGGSTNALIHLTAIAGRAGIRVDLDGFDRLGRETPVLVDLKPTGQGYMEDLHRAGGLLPILRALKPMLSLDCLTVTGRTLGAELEAGDAPFRQPVVRPLAEPVYASGAMVVLRGNLAPDGAVIKQCAADQGLLQHTGPALVFADLADLAARIDDEALPVTPDTVLVLQNAGPKGAPGMPEAGYLPIPKKLMREGVKDMVRISDARMSGTAFGTIVLHVSPEAAAGGPLALVRTGDMIRLDHRPDDGSTCCWTTTRLPRGGGKSRPRSARPLPRAATGACGQRGAAGGWRLRFLVVRAAGGATAPVV